MTSIRASAQLQYMTSNSSYPFRLELERKAIHLSSLWMACAIWWLPQLWALSIFMVVLAGMLSFEVLRWHPKTQRFVPKILTRTLRGHEQGTGAFRLTGASYTLLAAIAAALLFPKLIAVTAFTIMIIGDAFAALIGKPFGRTPFLGKSLEGSAAFIVSSMIALCIFYLAVPLPDGYLLAAFIATSAGMLAEALASRLKLDDNLAITLGAGSAMMCFYRF